MKELLAAHTVVYFIASSVFRLSPYHIICEIIIKLALKMTNIWSVLVSTRQYIGKLKLNNITPRTSQVSPHTRLAVVISLWRSLTFVSIEAGPGVVRSQSGLQGRLWQCSALSHGCLRVTAHCGGSPLAQPDTGRLLTAPAAVPLYAGRRGCAARLRGNPAAPQWAPGLC